MNHILSRREGEVLAQMAWSRVLLAFDFDGTLAPIVGDRDAAVMRSRTAELFRRVCELYPCAVISGRSSEDVSARLGGAPVRHVFGNHGLEPGVGIESFARQVASMRPRLEGALSEWPGVDIEDKKYSIAVHYRRSRRRKDARRAIDAAIAGLSIPTRVIPGKLVVNVVPEGAPHKGQALLTAREREAADTALYVGDDVTDEDVFQLDQPGRLLTIRVGLSRSSAAAYYLRGQREMDALLAKLAELRARNRGR